MKTNFKKLYAVVFLFVATIVMAQVKTVSGTVTDAQGDRVPSAVVTVKSTGNYVTTDLEGNFTVEVAEGDTLIIDDGNGAPNEVIVGKESTIAVKLEPTAGVEQLKEVVVTALGIKREKKALGYATQGVSGEDMSDQPISNFASALQGEIAGLDVKSSGTMGGSANMIIRGYSSISQSNQALVVIDGTPVINTTNNSSDQRTGRGGYDYGNAASDINPDDIASVTVLKGAAATALYGSRANNGAIIITTKSGKSKKGIGLVYNTSYMASSADKTTLPVYQNRYGAGYSAEYGLGGDQYFDDYYDINGDSTADQSVHFEADASFGAAFDPSKFVYQWNSLYPQLSTYQQATPWVAAKHTPNDFFKIGSTFVNSLSFGREYENLNYRLGYTNFFQTGNLPNSEIKKNIFNINTGYKITEKLKTNVGFTYTNTKGLGRYGTGYDSNNPMQSFRQWWQTNVDLHDQRDAYMQTRENITWNATSATNTYPIYTDNAYWVRYENYESDVRDRYTGNISLDYKITDWMSVMLRATGDFLNERREERTAIGSSNLSEYRLFQQNAAEINYDAILSFNKDLTDGLNLDGNIGWNLREERNNYLDRTTNGGLVLPRIYTLENSVNALTPADIIRYDATKRVDGVYARASLGYLDTYYVEGTIRRDKSSALPIENNVYYYPSISTSIIFSKWIDQSWLSFGKIRANYAEVGNDTDPYQVYSSYLMTADFNGSSTATNPNNFNNPNLVEERSKDIELGLEMQFFKRRFGFDISYYKRTTQDLITAVDVSTSTGASRVFLNAGDIENKGLEIFLNGTPIKTTNFSWEIKVNFAKNENEVTKLADGISYLPLANVQGGVSIGAQLGESFGVIRGRNFVYTNGERTIGANGYYLRTPSNAPQVIGNINPDWTGGVKNTIKYKNWSLGFLIDIKKGGDVFSLDTYYGYATGLYDFTAADNDLGNPVRNSIANGGGLILEGVLADGSPNTIRISPEDFYSGPWGYYRAPAAAHVYDAGFVKLREATVTYNLPSSFLGNSQIQGMSFSIIGRNLWIIHKNVPYADPEAGLSAGNVQGYQSGSYPAIREIGASIKINF